MEAKVTFKLYTQQLKIRSYIFLHVLISSGKKKKASQKPPELEVPFVLVAEVEALFDFNILPWMPINK